MLFSVVRFSVSLASGEIEVPPRVSPAGRCTSASHCQKCNGVGMGNTVHSKQKTLLLNVMLIFGVFCLMIFVVLLMHCWKLLLRSSLPAGVVFINGFVTVCSGDVSSGTEWFPKKWWWHICRLVCVVGWISDFTMVHRSGCLFAVTTGCVRGAQNSPWVGFVAWSPLLF